MALTNSQHDAIMRTYDAIRTENRHIQNERYAQVTAACPEIAQIEDDIIGLSMQAAAEMLKNPDYKTAYRKKLSELADRKAACLAAPWQTCGLFRACLYLSEMQGYRLYRSAINVPASPKKPLSWCITILI